MMNFPRDACVYMIYALEAAEWNILLTFISYVPLNPERRLRNPQVL